MNLLKWNATAFEWQQFETGDKIDAELIDPTFNEDVKINTSESGIVLTAPNGDTFRVQIGNDGVLITTNITPV